MILKKDNTFFRQGEISHNVGFFARKDSDGS